MASTTRSTAKTATATKPATRTTRAARTPAAPAPATPAGDPGAAKLLAGVTTSATKPGTTRGRPAPKPAPAAKAAAAKPATKGAAAKPATPAKAKAEPKVNAKQLLAQLVVTAAAAAVDAGKGPAGMTKDEQLRLLSQWLHYLPVGSVWPKCSAPVPARHEWDPKTGQRR